MAGYFVFIARHGAGGKEFIKRFFSKVFTGSSLVAYGDNYGINYNLWKQLSIIFE